MSAASGNHARFSQEQHHSAHHAVMLARLSQCNISSVHAHRDKLHLGLVGCEALARGPGVPAGTALKVQAALLRPHGPLRLVVALVHLLRQPAHAQWCAALLP